MSITRTFTVFAAAAGCVLSGLAAVASPAQATTGPWDDGTAFVASQGLRFGYGAAYAITPTGGESYLGGGSAEDIAVASDGTVYWVTCSGFVDKYVPGYGASTVATLPSCGTSIAIEPSGKLLVGDFSHLYEMNTDGTGVTTLEAGQVFSSLAVDAAGDIYAVDGGQYLEVRPAGSTSFTRTSGLPLDGQLRSVRLAADNSLFVGTTSGAAYIPLSGAPPTQYSTGGDDAGGASVDQAGDIWISDEKDSPSTGDQVDYIPAGGSLSVLATGFDDPQGLAVYPLVTQPARSASTVTVARSTVNQQRQAKLTATVDGGAATNGYVQFSIDGNAVNDVATVNHNGKASTTVTLPKGTHNITATYLGSTTQNPSVSAPSSYHLPPLASTTTLTTDSTTVAQADPVDVTATVTGRSGLTPTGDVGFYVNNRLVTDVELDSNGQATASLQLPPGTPHVRATYHGDEVYNNSSATQDFTTTAPYTSSTQADVHYGSVAPSGRQHISIDVTVTGQRGEPQPTGTVTADNGFSCSALAGMSNPRTATSTCRAMLAPDYYDVTISYSGDSTYATSSTDASFYAGGGG